MSIDIERDIDINEETEEVNKEISNLLHSSSIETKLLVTLSSLAHSTEVIARNLEPVLMTAVLVEKERLSKEIIKTKLWTFVGDFVNSWSGRITISVSLLLLSCGLAIWFGLDPQFVLQIITIIRGVQAI